MIQSCTEPIPDAYVSTAVAQFSLSLAPLTLPTPLSVPSHLALVVLSRDVHLLTPPFRYYYFIFFLRRLTSTSSEDVFA